MKIMVVEDQYLIALLTAELLKDAGHTVIGPVASVSEALALCKDNPPDLALIDIHLKGSATGVDLARQLNDWWGKISIFVSSSCQEARQAHDLAFGLIEKPYTSQVLLRSVQLFAAIKDQQPASPKPFNLEIF